MSEAEFDEKPEWTANQKQQFIDDLIRLNLTYNDDYPAVIGYTSF